MNEETRTQQEIYEFNMTEEQLQEFRTRAIRQTTIYETRPYLQKLEDNYMNILEEAYLEEKNDGRGREWKN